MTAFGVAARLAAVGMGQIDPLQVSWLDLRLQRFYRRPTGRSNSLEALFDGLRPSVSVVFALHSLWLVLAELEWVWGTVRVFTVCCSDYSVRAGWLPRILNWHESRRGRVFWSACCLAHTRV